MQLPFRPQGLLAHAPLGSIQSPHVLLQNYKSPNKTISELKYKNELGTTVYVHVYYRNYISMLYIVYNYQLNKN